MRMTSFMKLWTKSPTPTSRIVGPFCYLKHNRHPEPFNKTERGNQRRAARRFKIASRDFEFHNINDHAPAMSRKEYWRAVDVGII